jgi:tetratricopeptide (TPR) repeat protein
MKTNAIHLLGIVALFFCFISCESKDEKLVRQAGELINKQDLEGAVQLIDQAATLNPENTKAYMLKCKVFLLKDAKTQADEYLEKALTDTDFDSDGDLFFEMGNLYAKSIQYANAIRCYQVAVRNGEEYSHSYVLTSNPSPGAETKWYRSFSFYFFALGNSYAMIGDCKEALNSYNAAIGTANKGMQSGDLMQEGVDLVFSGEKKDRLNYREYVGSFLYNRGLIFSHLNQFSEANEDINQAKELNYIRELVLDSSKINCQK